jgi:Domain of unknown function (DUF4260)
MTENTGVVGGMPARFLRVDAAILFAFSIWLFAIQGLAWWWYPALLLVPDIFMLGYLVNTKLGAFVYNVGHSMFPGLILLGVGVATASPLTAAIGAIWLGHVGWDRSLGYGLKYHDAFQHTHLGVIGKKAK